MTVSYTKPGCSTAGCVCNQTPDGGRAALQELIARTEQQSVNTLLETSTPPAGTVLVTLVSQCPLSNLQ